MASNDTTDPASPPGQGESRTEQEATVGTGGEPPVEPTRGTKEPPPDPPIGTPPPRG